MSRNQGLRSFDGIEIKATPNLCHHLLIPQFLLIGTYLVGLSLIYSIKGYIDFKGDIVNEIFLRMLHLFENLNILIKFVSCMLHNQGISSTQVFSPNIHHPTDPISYSLVLPSLYAVHKTCLQDHEVLKFG